MAQQATIRGLAIRANFALARAVYQATGDEEAAFDMSMSVDEALWLGFNDRFCKGETSAPIMFADEPVLHDAWLDGHDRAVSALEEYVGDEEIRERIKEEGIAEMNAMFGECVVEMDGEVPSC